MLAGRLACDRIVGAERPVRRQVRDPRPVEGGDESLRRICVLGAHRDREREFGGLWLAVTPSVLLTPANSPVMWFRSGDGVTCSACPRHTRHQCSATSTIEVPTLVMSRPQLRMSFEAAGFAVASMRKERLATLLEAEPA